MQYNKVSSEIRKYEESSMNKFIIFILLNIYEILLTLLQKFSIFVKIGLSKPEFTSVENGYVDDPVRNNSLKSARSLKQKGKPAKIANEAVV